MEQQLELNFGTETNEIAFTKKEFLEKMIQIRDDNPNQRDPERFAIFGAFQLWRDNETFYLDECSAIMNAPFSTKEKVDNRYVLALDTLNEWNLWCIEMNIPQAIKLSAARSYMHFELNKLDAYIRKS